jgi:CheY-like chemotaxis protein
MPQNHSDAFHAILVAAGTADLRSAIAAVLGKENYRLVLAINGKEAFDEANAQHFDLVVSGIEMSELDGIELLAKLRKAKPRLPVFIVAQGKSKIDATYLRYAALLGADGTFEHPVDAPAFLQAVDAMIREGRRNRAPQEV